RLCRRKSIKLIELNDQPFIINSNQTGPKLNAVVMLACQRAGFIPKVTQESPQISTMLCLVESGIGVALVPSITAQRGTARIEFRDLGNDDYLQTGLSLARKAGEPSRLVDHFRAIAMESA
ncbi:MAG: LysR family substrate-binding domain-containing protein, partial [Gimesia chilikensis]